jgi:opacity protein-like surface antigen
MAFMFRVPLGATWTRSTLTESSSEPFLDTRQDFFNGILEDASQNSGVNNFSSGLSGKNGGAVFTFTTGYNFVWSNWLLGYQGETSWNLSKTRLTGGSSFSSTNTFVQTFPLPPSTPQTDAFSQVGNDEHQLQNDWTISAMARVGYLLTNDLLLYGLAGWSWGGFDLDPGNGGRSFTMNGFTWGGGIEQNFGWLRAFVQAKVIDYGHKDVTTSNSGSTNEVETSGLATTVFTTTNGGSLTQHLTANVVSVTAGITIPLQFGH